MTSSRMVCQSSSARVLVYTFFQQNSVVSSHKGADILKIMYSIVTCSILFKQMFCVCKLTLNHTGVLGGDSDV